MQGLIFVTWEKFLSHEFGMTLLDSYRTAIGETVATSPLVNRVYDDKLLLVGVGVASQLTGVSAETLLRKYGHYFVMNSLTSHLCSYLLSQVHNARELLLTMRSAHAQLRRTADALTPPLFRYEMIPGKPQEMVLIYGSHRQLCPVLLGAIEGAAERYQERIRITEATCMKRGDAVCRFHVNFIHEKTSVREEQTPQQQERLRAKRYLAQLLLKVLPDSDGVTLTELQQILQQKRVSPHFIRPSVLLEGLQHLHHVGLVNSTANLLQDDLMQRRYWRAPTSDEWKLTTWG